MLLSFSIQVKTIIRYRIQDTERRSKEIGCQERDVTRILVEKILDCEEKKRGKRVCSEWSSSRGVATSILPVTD